MSVIFQSGIFKIPSDHQAQEQHALSARVKVGLIRLIYQAIMVGPFYQTRKCVAGSMVRSRQRIDFHNYYRGQPVVSARFQIFGKRPEGGCLM